MLPVVSWHFWDEAHNGRAQERAKQRYCTAYPTDVVCRPFTGGQCYDIYYDVYGFVFAPNYPLSNTEQKLGSALLGQINGIVRGIDHNGSSALYRLKYTRGNGSVVYQDMLSSSEPNSGVVISRVIIAYGNPDVCGNPPPLPWKDWPQAKRDRAVALLNDADWQRLATSMPVGGTLDPGDSVKAPKIGIPGQEWDNPNTPLDDRRFKSIPEEYPRPTFPDLDHDSDPDETDADDDNDGFLDPYDPQPRNPAVPTATIDAPSSPPDQPSNPPDSEPGEGVTGEGAFATEETLPYDPPSKVIGQLKPDSCVAASCRMAVYDSTTDDIPEAFLRDAAGVVKNEGAFLRDATNALAEHDIASRYESSLSPEELKSVTKNGAAIVAVSTPTTNGKHALIVDGFEGDYTLIRDPLPEEKGAAYKIKTEKFMNAWTGEAVIIEP